MTRKEKLEKIYTERYLYGKLGIIQLSDRMVRKYIQGRSYGQNPFGISDYEREPEVILAVGDYDLSIRVKIYHYLHENIEKAHAMGGTKYYNKDDFILSKDYNDYMSVYL